jgi:hypothetical protein
MLTATTHFTSRKKQRGLRREILDFILEFGEVRFARNATWLVIQRRRLPVDVRNTNLAVRAAEWLVLVEGGILVTCYRNTSPMKHLARSH